MANNSREICKVKLDHDLWIVKYVDDDFLTLTQPLARARGKSAPFVLEHPEVIAVLPSGIEIMIGKPMRGKRDG